MSLNIGGTFIAKEKQLHLSYLRYLCLQPNCDPSTASSHLSSTHLASSVTVYSARFVKLILSKALLIVTKTVGRTPIFTSFSVKPVKGYGVRLTGACFANLTLCAASTACQIDHPDVWKELTNLNHQKNLKREFSIISNKATMTVVWCACINLSYTVHQRVCICTYLLIHNSSCQMRYHFVNVLSAYNL